MRKKEKKKWQKPQIEVIKPAPKRTFLNCDKADYGNASPGDPTCTEPTMCLWNHFS